MREAEKGLGNVRALEAVIRVATESEGDTPIAALTAWYQLAPVHAIGGHWYFTALCPTCRGRIPLFGDYSDGNLGNPFKGYGVIGLCSQCHARSTFPSETLESMRWPLANNEALPVTEYSKRIPRKHKQDPEERPLTGPLYHYTSLDALVSIVDTKALWATNVHYLNDASESEHGLAIMRTLATTAAKTSKGTDAEFLRNFLDWLDQRDSQGPAVYVLCFSEAHDQLSQWRGYTPHGRGICLGLKASNLVYRMQAQGWTFQSCRYEQESQLAWAESILARMRRESAVASEAPGADPTQIFGAVLNRSLPDLLQVAATIKNEAFREEKEVRFISPVIVPGDSRVEYRVGRTALIPYVRFHLEDPPGKLQLNEITVGPSPSQILTRGAIYGLTAKHGVSVDTDVSLSSVPYREL
jgi:hypothetical protein